MRSVKAGLFAGAISAATWGALFLLAGCTVPDSPPVASSRPLAALTGLEEIRVCEWSIDYMGGYDYDAPESDSEEYTARHLCPPSEEDLALPEENEERTWFYWSNEACTAFMELIETGCNGTVGDFAQIVRRLAETPCRSFSLELSNGCVFTYTFDEDG